MLKSTDVQGGSNTISKQSNLLRKRWKFDG